MRELGIGTLATLGMLCETLSETLCPCCRGLVCGEKNSPQTDLSGKRQVYCAYCKRATGKTEPNLPVYIWELTSSQFGFLPWGYCHGNEGSPDWPLCDWVKVGIQGATLMVANLVGQCCTWPEKKQCFLLQCYWDQCFWNQVYTVESPW